MKLDKQQTAKIRLLYKKAEVSQSKAMKCREELRNAIVKFTGVDGFVDYFSDDGFGFTPKSDNDTHVSIDFILHKAMDGIDITEELILDNLSF